MSVSQWSQVGKDRPVGQVMVVEREDRMSGGRGWQMLGESREKRGDGLESTFIERTGTEDKIRRVNWGESVISCMHITHALRY